MEFYTKFRELYNVAKTKESSIEFKDEEWKDFNKKLSSYSLENLEEIYKVILHYYYIENKKVSKEKYQEEFEKVFNGSFITLKDSIVKYENIKEKAIHRINPTENPINKIATSATPISSLFKLK